MTQNRWELLTCWEFSGNITCTISTSAQIQWVEHTREVQTTSGICDVTRTKKKVRGLRLQCKTTELPLISYFIWIFFKVVLRNSEGLAVLFFGYWVFFHPLSVQSCTWPFFLDFFSFLFPCLPNHLMLTAESFKHKKVPHSRKKNSIPSASKLAKNQFQNLSLGILLLAACHKTRGKRFYWVINPNLNILIQSAINMYGEGQDRGTTVKPYSNLEKMVEVHGHVMVWGCWGSCHDNLIHHIRSSGKGLIGSSMTMMPNTANEVKAYCGGM